MKMFTYQHIYVLANLDHLLKEDPGVDYVATFIQLKFIHVKIFRYTYMFSYIHVCRPI